MNFEPDPRETAVKLTERRRRWSVPPMPTLQDQFMAAAIPEAVFVGGGVIPPNPLLLEALHGVDRMIKPAGLYDGMGLPDAPPLPCDRARDAMIAQHLHYCYYDVMFRPRRTGRSLVPRIE